MDQTNQTRADQTPGMSEQFPYAQYDRQYLVTTPVAHYYALLVGGALVTLGILGFIPFVTRGNVLFGIFHVSGAYNVIHLLTGIAGLLVFAFPQHQLARPYALFIAAFYLATFTVGNILYGDAVNTPAIHVADIPAILANAFHAGLMLTGALVFGLSALQQGDRATERFRYRYTREVERTTGPNNEVPTA